MSLIERWAYVIAAICYAPLPPDPPRPPAPIEQHQPKANVRSVMTQSLPELRGDSLQIQIIEVRYAPGESSTPHSHPCPVIGYVLSGAVRMQVQPQGAAEPEPPRVYGVGESFYEDPNGRHLVSANASQIRPATFLATFVCDNPTALSVPAAPVKGDSHP
jgi:quercetin dioxygenase-like cupin family protein